MGICNKGNNCPYAHDAEELRGTPNLERTKLCEELIRTGRCLNKKCTYAHSKDELRATPGFLKTKMCKFFIEGHCVLGPACRYAHSNAELRVSGNNGGTNGGPSSIAVLGISGTAKSSGESQGGPGISIAESESFVCPIAANHLCPIATSPAQVSEDPDLSLTNVKDINSNVDPVESQNHCVPDMAGADNDANNIPNNDNVPDMTGADKGRLNSDGTKSFAKTQCATSYPSVVLGKRQNSADPCVKGTQENIVAEKKRNVDSTLEKRSATVSTLTGSATISQQSPAVSDPQSIASTMSDHNSTSGDHNSTSGDHNSTSGDHNSTSGDHNTGGDHNINSKLSQVSETTVAKEETTALALEVQEQEETTALALEVHEQEETTALALEVHEQEETTALALEVQEQEETTALALEVHGQAECKLKTDLNIKSERSDLNKSERTKRRKRRPNRKKKEQQLLSCQTEKKNHPGRSTIPLNAVPPREKPREKTDPLIFCGVGNFDEKGCNNIRAGTVTDLEKVEKDLVSRRTCREDKVSENCGQVKNSISSPPKSKKKVAEQAVLVEPPTEPSTESTTAELTSTIADLLRLNIIRMDMSAREARIILESLETSQKFSQKFRRERLETPNLYSVPPSESGVQNPTQFPEVGTTKECTKESESVRINLQKNPSLCDDDTKEGKKSHQGWKKNHIIEEHNEEMTIYASPHSDNKKHGPLKNPPGSEGSTQTLSSTTSDALLWQERHTQMEFSQSLANFSQSGQCDGHEYNGSASLVGRDRLRSSHRDCADSDRLRFSTSHSMSSIPSSLNGHSHRMSSSSVKKHRSQSTNGSSGHLNLVTSACETTSDNVDNVKKQISSDIDVKISSDIDVSTTSPDIFDAVERNHEDHCPRPDRGQEELCGEDHLIVRRDSDSLSYQNPHQRVKNQHRRHRLGAQSASFCYLDSAAYSSGRYLDRRASNGDAAVGTKFSIHGIEYSKDADSNSKDAGALKDGSGAYHDSTGGYESCGAYAGGYESCGRYSEVMNKDGKETSLDGNHYIGQRQREECQRQYENSNSSNYYGQQYDNSNSSFSKKRMRQTEMALKRGFMSAGDLLGCKEHCDTGINILLFFYTNVQKKNLV